MRHIISVLLENESGALSRVSGLFSARGYNIESLTVAPTNDSSLSRMTIVTVGDDRKIDQIEKQLSKLIDVAALQDITVNQHLEREVALIKVQLDDAQKKQVEKIIKVFNAELIDAQAEQRYVIEVCGSSEKIDELIKAISDQQIIETARSGVTGLTTGGRDLIVTN